MTLGGNNCCRIVDHTVNPEIVSVTENSIMIHNKRPNLNKRQSEAENEKPEDWNDRLE